MQEGKKIPFKPEFQKNQFLHYVEDLQLREDLAPDMDICVIGSGSSYFSEELRKHSDAVHVVDVEPREAEYEVPKTAQVINHDSLNIGVPDASFDLVISYHSFPKYFVFRTYTEAQRAKILTEKSGAYFSHSYGEVPATSAEVYTLIEQSLKELLRITREGGKIKLFPLSAQLYTIVEKMLIGFGVPKESIRQFKNSETPKSKNLLGIEVVK